jgi:glucosyl-dolichyl phosphate glucuronosyltransferase
MGDPSPVRTAEQTPVTPGDGEPRVSVVICAYDLRRYDDLVAAVESVLSQTLAPTEVVVAVDRNPALLERLRLEMPRVIAVANVNHPGAGGARNTGVAMCSGDIVAFIDDDARASGSWLEQLLAAFDDPDVVGAGGRIDPAWDSGRPSWFPEEFDWVVGCTYRGLPEHPAAVRNVISANMAVRRASFEAIGGFLPGFGKQGTRSEPEETELCIRTSRHFPGARWLYMPNARVSHRVPVTRQSGSYFVERCINEGRGKARMRSVGRKDERLTTERAYVLRTLPSGIVRGVVGGFRGDSASVCKAISISVGFCITATAYAAERVRLKRSHRARTKREGSGRSH